jgi:bacteriorhodopsin
MAEKRNSQIFGKTKEFWCCFGHGVGTTSWKNSYFLLLVCLYNVKRIKMATKREKKNNKFFNQILRVVVFVCVFNLLTTFCLASKARQTKIYVEINKTSTARGVDYLRDYFPLGKQSNNREEEQD